MVLLLGVCTNFLPEFTLDETMLCYRANHTMTL